MPLLASGAVIVLIAIGAMWYILALSEEGAPTPAPAEAFTPVNVEVGAQVSEAAETPADKLPTTNPFSDYKNPFE